MTDSYTIAIDGYSACGKSTLARRMATELGYRYIDTGAMYRAVTLHFQREGVDIDEPDEVRRALDEVSIDFAPRDRGGHTLLNGEDVEDEIRSLAVSRFVSPVAALPAVRRALVERQRQLGADGRVILDGRDIGTVVFPTADLKLFITADADTRTQRRLDELRAAGKPATRSAVAANLAERDHIDSTRADSPLRQAPDAVVIDNSCLSLDEFVERGLAEVARLGA